MKEIWKLITSCDLLPELAAGRTECYGLYTLLYIVVHMYTSILRSARFSSYLRAAIRITATAFAITGPFRMR